MSSRSQTHTQTYTLTLSLSLSSTPFLLHSSTHTPVSTANPKPCHNRERVTPQSAKPLQFISHKKSKDKKALQSITAHRTALLSHHWHLGERLAGGGRRRGAGRHFLSNPSSGLVLHCGHLLILCWYTGQLAAESNHGRRLDRRRAVIIISNNIKVLLYH